MLTYRLENIVSSELNSILHLHSSQKDMDILLFERTLATFLETFPIITTIFFCCPNLQR